MKNKYFDSPENNFKARLELNQPILTNDNIEKIRNIEQTTKGRLKASTIDILLKFIEIDELREGIDRICFKAKSRY